MEVSGRACRSHLPLGLRGPRHLPVPTDSQVVWPERLLLCRPQDQAWPLRDGLACAQGLAPAPALRGVLPTPWDRGGSRPALQGLAPETVLGWRWAWVSGLVRDGPSRRLPG